MPVQLINELNSQTMKRIQFLSLLLCLFICICSCSNKNELKNEYTLSKTEDEIIIELGKESRNIAQHIQYFKNADTNFLALFNMQKNWLEVYNLDSHQLYKRLQVQYEGQNSFGEMMGFYVINFDSILVLSIRPKILGIFDIDGTIKTKISFDRDLNNKLIKTTIPWEGQRPYLIQNKLSLGQIWDCRESRGLLTDIGIKGTPVEIFIDLITKECNSSNITYPQELMGKNIATMPVIRTKGYNNEYIYHFALLNYFYRTKDHNSFEKVQIESNYKLDFSNLDETKMMKGLSDKILHDAIVNIVYDEYREHYYVFIRQRANDQETLDIKTELLYPDCFILILDKNLHFEGEVFLPEKIYSYKMIFITSKGLYISEDNVANPTFSEDIMRFRLFTLEKIN
jgi:hypothetical protein